MRSRAIMPGDLVEVSIGGVKFNARVEALLRGWVMIKPLSSWATWRRVRLTDITKRIDPPPCRRRRRAAA